MYDVLGSVTLLLSEIAEHSPLISNPFRTSGIDWEELQENYPMLSSGEQAVVDLCCSLTGRACFDEDGPRYPSLFNTITAMDIKLRQRAFLSLTAWAGDLAGYSREDA